MRLFPNPLTVLLCLTSLPLPAVLAQSSWTVTPAPMGANWTRAIFEDVTAIGPQDAWAVGQFRTPIPPYFSEGHTLAMHWDGSSWSHVPTPSPSPFPGGMEASLNAVDAVAPDDVWAGGSREGTASGLSVGAWIHVQHWDGASWTEVPVPGGTGMNYSGTRVYEVLALAPDDVWFGGAWGTSNWQRGGVDWHPLAMHWDGSGMTIHPTPVVHDNSAGAGFASVSMSALAPDDIWAACQKDSAGGFSRKNVIIHWDGSAWSLVPVPDSSVDHSLHSIEALAPDDVWVFGDSVSSPNGFALHYDGSSWTEITGSAVVTASHAFAPDDIYVAHSAVSHFDGTSWVVQATFPQSPLIHALDSDGGTGLWAVGSYWVSGSGLRPFAARATGLRLPVLEVANLTSGATATFSVQGAAPHSLVMFGLSLTGSGPLATPFGNLNLSPPIGLLPFQFADTRGQASVHLGVPAGLTGLRVFSQAATAPITGGSVAFSNWLSLTVQ